MTDSRRIAGIKGAITRVKRAIAANEEDIRNGHNFKHFLIENRQKLARLERKMERAQMGFKK